MAAAHVPKQIIPELKQQTAATVWLKVTETLGVEQLETNIYQLLGCLTFHELRTLL